MRRPYTLRAARRQEKNHTSPVAFGICLDSSQWSSTTLLRGITGDMSFFELISQHYYCSDSSVDIVFSRSFETRKRQKTALENDALRGEDYDIPDDDDDDSDGVDEMPLHPYPRRTIIFCCWPSI